MKVYIAHNHGGCSEITKHVEYLKRELEIRHVICDTPFTRDIN